MLESQKPARKGRPPSGKVKVTVAINKSVADRLKLIPEGIRGQTVERALVLVFDGPGIAELETLTQELAPLSIRFQQCVEMMQLCYAISDETNVRIATEAASIIHFVAKLLKA